MRISDISCGYVRATYAACMVERGLPVLTPHSPGGFVSSRRLPDGRNVHNPADWREPRWDVRNMGRR